jgi:hypothetical protein
MKEVLSPSANDAKSVVAAIRAQFEAHRAILACIRNIPRDFSDACVFNRKQCGHYHGITLLFFDRWARLAALSLRYGVVASPTESQCKEAVLTVPMCRIACSLLVKDLSNRPGGQKWGI